MAETLMEKGHDVVVLTGFPNWPEGRLYPGYKIKLRQKEMIGGVPVIRIPLYPNHSKSKIRRISNYLSFVISASLLGVLFIRRPDIIHAIQPPTTCLPAWILSRLWRIPFTYEVQDMWPETLEATGMMNNKKVLSMVSRFCDWSYRKADAIRVISPGFRENLIAKGVPPEKIHVISNWVDTDFYKPRKSNPALAEKFGFQNKFNILYAGTIGPAQGLATVLKAAQLLKNMPAVQFVIAGEGLALSDLQEYAQAHDISNVKFLGRQPMSLMPELYALSDILLVHLKDDPLFRITIPHKTLTYLAAGKPVLAAVEGDGADIVKEHCAGVTCLPSNPALLAEQVSQLLKMSTYNRSKLGENGRQAALHKYGKDKLVKDISLMLQTAAGCNVP
ncbi:MAG: glycosyltransferase family 4 protein [Smithellaceae bacterium]|nr:glycosyltransferase family 4 protein [Smithellaceae bacterium]